MTIHYVPSGGAIIQIIVEMRFHLYTEGWSFNGVYTPDYLFDLYHSSNYWHDPVTYSPNYCRINDTVLDQYLEGIKYGKSIQGPDFNWPVYPDPVTKYINSSCWAAQERFYDMVHTIPLYCVVGKKAVSKSYVGDDLYKDDSWEHFATQTAFGIDSYWTFLNGFPEGHPYGEDGHPITMNYGWSTNLAPYSLNVLYADWYQDWLVLDKIYETLAMRNPYDSLKIIPWMINNYSIGIWKCPGYSIYVNKGNYSKLRISLRSGIYWSDGHPLTISDVLFSLTESSKLLLWKGYSPTTWYYVSEHIVGYKLLDPCTLEILFNVPSYFLAEEALTSVPIIPEHIWRSIIGFGTPKPPDDFQPDPTMVGSGPFKFVSLNAGVSLELESNKNYFRYLPILPEFNTTTSYPRSRQDPGYPKRWKLVTVDFVVPNLWMNATGDGYLLADAYIYLDNSLSYSHADISIPSGQKYIVTHTFNITKCYHNLQLSVLIKGPATLQSSVANPWVGRWANATLPLWITIKYDYAGGKYQNEVAAPDCKMDGKDLAFAAASYLPVPPPVRIMDFTADVNDDYKVDGKDIAWTAKFYARW